MVGSLMNDLSCNHLAYENSDWVELVNVNIALHCALRANYFSVDWRSQYAEACDYITKLNTAITPYYNFVGKVPNHILARCSLVLRDHLAGESFNKENISWHQWKRALNNSKWRSCRDGAADFICRESQHLIPAVKMYYPFLTDHHLGYDKSKYNEVSIING